MKSDIGLWDFSSCFAFQSPSASEPFPSPGPMPSELPAVAVPDEQRSFPLVSQLQIERNCSCHCEA
ncbi:hypothetical protein E2C01_004846 [Portunus trituberculatus]|uniref:Uncharacterized protein n=1 Tax=Portunus trituberculatus TaxID=210409 RepID=A0A5B7CSR4_PORTR|nr:hypothetical protein [Portunus trituberculatus]